MSKKGKCDSAPNDRFSGGIESGEKAQHRSREHLRKALEKGVDHYHQKQLHLEREIKALTQSGETKGMRKAVRGLLKTLLTLHAWHSHRSEMLHAQDKAADGVVEDRLAENHAAVIRRIEAGDVAGYIQSVSY